jgi:radical SAM superfamily enzyme YgiQ (UPF0313 family)
MPPHLGGPQVSFSGNTILENCNCDILVRHEGEKKLIEILNYYIRGKSQLKNINGIAFRDNSEIVNTPEAELIDLDTLPSPDYSILTNSNHWHIPQDCSPEKAKRFLEYISIKNKGYISSRGCPYNCIFCVEGNLKQKHRMRSIENVEKDLRLLLSQTGLKFINFMDDTFTSSRKRVLEMCDMINRIRKDYDFRWYIEGRVNILAENLDLIDIMVDSGLTYLQVGIESGSQKVLDAQNKRITTDQLRVVFSKIGKLKNKNIAIVGNIILGNAGETEESLMETLTFAKELYKLADFNASITFGFLVPFQGTPIKENPNKYDLKIIDDDFELNMYQFKEVICHPKNLNISTLNKYYLLYLRVLSVFFRVHIYKLNKPIIDRRIAFDKSLARNFNDLPLQPWRQTTYSSYFLRRYYVVFERDNIINELNFVSTKLCPVRLWEINYDINNCYYYFTSLNGEKNIIEGNHIYLWEMATGQYTIEEIVSHENSPYNNQEYKMEDIMDFYIKMYNSFALLLSSY